MNKQATDIFTAFLKKGKNRITPERFEVMEAAIEYEGHFGADDLYIAMKNKKTDVSRATVYNTVELLAQCDLITKRNFGDNLTRYESNYKKQSHDHLICIDCGKIIEFSNPKIRKIQDEICKELKFEAVSYSFNIFGRCKSLEDCKSVDPNKKSNP
jgi:Fur family transcriptional regulator, ferric uptake regulator